MTTIPSTERTVIDGEDRLKGTDVTAGDQSILPIANVDGTHSEAVKVEPDVIDDLAKLKPLIADTLPLRDNNIRRSIIKIVCGSTVTLVILGIVSIIPILQLIIGWRYADDCSISWRIPHYLVVSGVLGLAAIVLTIIQSLLALYTKSKIDEIELQTPAMAAACGLCGVSIVLFFLIVFLIGWFVAGCIWVFRVWNRVQYLYIDRSDYCNPTLYRFAFWLLLISIIYYLFSCMRLCFQVRKQVTDRKEPAATRVPTTEP